MKTLLLNVEENKVEIIDIEDTLEAMYEAIGCDIIEGYTRKIGGRWFDVVCDGDGCFRENPKISAISDMGEPMFVGNLLFFNRDGENWTALKDEDVEYIKKRILPFGTERHPEPYLMLTRCNWR